MTLKGKTLRPVPEFESRLDLPIALVIGAGGLGMAIAQRLGQHHRVVVTGLHEQELSAARERLHELGVVFIAIRCDITDSGSVQTLSRAMTQLGKVQALVHVAAVSPATADWRMIFNVNLAGAARIEEAMLPLMSPGGAAVFISSAGGHRPRPDAGLKALLDNPLADSWLQRLEAINGPEFEPGLAYALSKWGLNRLAKRKALAWGKRRCRILTLSPGIIDTLMGAAADSHRAGESKARMREKLPLGRDGSMAEVTDAVEYLVSSRASYITGTDILVDGGLAAGLQFPGEPA